MNTFKNKYAIVTAVNRNFSRQIIQKITSMGLTGLILADKTINEELIQKITTQTGCACHGFEFDITKTQTIEQLFQFALEKFPTVHILINAANICPTTPLEELDAQKWDECMNINLRGAHLLTKEAIKIMQAQNYGKIVHIASIQTSRINGLPPSVSYIVSQGGLITAVKYYAKFYAADNININTVSPNFAGMRDAEEEHEGIKSVAATVGFLISDEAKYITGANIDVSGRSCYCNRIF
ncbi:SDR family NAD(P)-dependent oxidoreductase [Neisseria sp. Ec49-e6-T10]|uniref:SDR family NAD(P)-dependent oxidoreductase n=1 Tax=Neisseria sp. Ec49-e6-T10 TaxID=3140744 RepID=UPI003EB83088